MQPAEWQATSQCCRGSSVRGASHWGLPLLGPSRPLDEPHVFPPVSLTPTHNPLQARIEGCARRTGRRPCAGRPRERGKRQAPAKCLAAAQSPQRPLLTGYVWLPAGAGAAETKRYASSRCTAWCAAGSGRNAGVQRCGRRSGCLRPRLSTPAVVLGDSAARRLPISLCQLEVCGCCRRLSGSGIRKAA